MALHEVQLKGYSVRPGNLSLGTYDSYGIEQLHVTLDDTWSGLAIDATFHNTPNDKGVTMLVDTDGLVTVPPEACMRASKYATITFRGVQDGVQRISCNLPYMVLDHAQVPGANSTATPSEIAQALAQMQGLRDGAVDAKNQAEAARDDAAKSAVAAKESETNASQSATAAKTAQKAAASSASSASTSASTATTQAAAAKSSADAAASSATAAKASEAAAGKSAQGAAASESAAKAAQTAAETAKANADIAASNAAAKATAAAKSAVAAKESETNAGQSATAAANSATAAAGSATAAAGDAKTASDAAAGAADAKAAAVAAQKDAAASKAAAANSSAAAKTSEDAAAKSAADADSTANSIKESMTQIAANKEAVSQLKEDTAALKKRQNVLVGSETGNPIDVDDAFAAPLCGLTVYGRSTQDGTPTPDAPVPIVSAGDSGSVAVKVTGANILYLPDIEENTVYGVTYSVKNGVIKIKGTSTGKHVRLLRNIKLFVGTWFFNPNPVKGTESSNCYLDLTNTRNLGFSIRSNNINKPVKITELNVKYPFYLDIESTAGSVIDMEWKPQMLLSDKLLPYSPYREQLLTLPTPNGLPGIPVTSGGNYTDQNGQQWICDEVDLERGVTVQRVDKAAFDSTKTLAEQNAILATPIETPLTPAEIAAYKALTAYAPDTVVQASDGAGVKLEYQRDVNIAIKKLEDAIASMTAT